MFENSTWISGIASEELKNQSICIYNPNDQMLRNIKDRNEIATNIFVFIDANEVVSYDTINKPIEKIKQGEWVRCLRIHILA